MSRYADEAMNSWVEVVGADNVITDIAATNFASTATYTTSNNVLAVIRPRSASEVQQCVRIANRFRIPLYPISGGRNWGFGSRVPTVSNSVILDLRLLNRILDCDPQLAYVTLEPGVTFRQLHRYLQEHAYQMMISMPSTSPDASVIGNVVERGHGSGTYGDRFEHVCGMEVVLPDGRCIHTGFGRFENAKSVRVDKWGVGPYVDGIFTQSNLGIVTQMTVWLAPLPKYFQVCCFGINSEEGLVGAIDILRELKLQEVIRSPISIWNDFKLISTFQRYPWEDTNFSFPIAEHVRAKIRRDRKISLWNGWIGIYSNSEEHGEVESRILFEAVAPKVDRIVFFGGREQRNIGYEDFEWDEKVLRETPYFGVPTESTIAAAYWRKPNPPLGSIDLDRDRCGKITCAPVVPFVGTHVQRVAEIINNVIQKYEFEPNIALIGITKRKIDVATFILFDRDNTDHERKAMCCYDDLLEKLIKEGYIPNRVGIQSMSSFPSCADDYYSFISSLKQALDPNDILAPLRYDFRNHW